jgi:hypothetical protein
MFNSSLMRNLHKCTRNLWIVQWIFKMHNIKKGYWFNQKMVFLCLHYLILPLQFYPMLFVVCIYKRHWASLEKERETKQDSLVRLQRFSQHVPHFGLLSIISIPPTTPILSVLGIC